MTTHATAYEYYARALVSAAVDDNLTNPHIEPAEQLGDAIRDWAALGGGEQTSVLIETTDLAAELVIRLAAHRGEHPDTTWQWLLSTPWTRGKKEQR